MFYEPDNIEYVAGRLRGTVIRKKDNSPFKVDDVVTADKGYVVFGRDIEKDIVEREKLEDLLLNSPRLGYSNFDGQAHYLGRFPMRRDWKQGLRRDNMFVLNKKVNRYPFKNYVPLIVPLKQRYPKYAECLERIEDIYDSCAFSPYFCIDKERKIIYKGQDRVGTARDEGPKLIDDYLWLTETLQEALT